VTPERATRAFDELTRRGFAPRYSAHDDRVRGQSGIMAVMVWWGESEWWQLFVSGGDGAPPLLGLGMTFEGARRDLELKAAVVRERAARVEAGAAALAETPSPSET